MEEKNLATETNAQTIASEEVGKVAVEDLEARNASLETEKARLVEEAANYRVAYLKEAKKNRIPEDDDEDDRMRRIAQETLAESRLAEIAREQDAIIKKALRENKELKMAVNNKTDIPATMGTHSEGTPVKDTVITQEQMSYFRTSLKWGDKEIEAYKKKLNRFAGR